MLEGGKKKSGVLEGFLRSRVRIDIAWWREWGGGGIREIVGEKLMKITEEKKLGEKIGEKQWGERAGEKERKEK